MSVPYPDSEAMKIPAVREVWDFMKWSEEFGWPGCDELTTWRRRVFGEET